jgi:hypothetical protein
VRQLLMEGASRNFAEPPRRHSTWFLRHDRNLLSGSQGKGPQELLLRATLCQKLKWPLLADSRSPANSSERQLWREPTLKPNASAAISGPKESPRLTVGVPRRAYSTISPGGPSLNY